MDNEFIEKACRSMYLDELRKQRRCEELRKRYTWDHEPVAGVDYIDTSGYREIKGPHTAFGIDIGGMYEYVGSKRNEDVD